MGFSFKVAPGVRLRASRRGFGASVGPRAARVHVSSRGRVGVSTGVGPASFYTALNGTRRRPSSRAGTPARRTPSSPRPRTTSPRRATGPTPAQLQRQAEARQAAEDLSALGTVHHQQFVPVSRPIATVEPVDAFQADVAARLKAAGLPVHTRFGVSGYRIDVAVAHGEDPDRMVLAVEADGPGYFSSPTARERDRLRQEHLERLGWRFARVWSTSWFRDPEPEVARIVEQWRAACADSGSSIDLAVALRPRPGAPAGSWAPPSSVRDRVGDPPAPLRDGPCPIRADRPSIDDYTPAELESLIRWIRSDTLLRTDEELLAVAVAELGFRRRGTRIVARLSAAIDATRG